jgi:hypothetical protein
MTTPTTSKVESGRRLKNSKLDRAALTNDRIEHFRIYHAPRRRARSHIKDQLLFEHSEPTLLIGKPTAALALRYVALI